MGRIRRGAISFALALLAALTSGCAANRGDIALLASGPDQQFDPAAVTKFADDQQKVLEQVQRLAGLSGPPQAGDWRAFVTAGFDFADSQCEAYIAALRRLDIARRRSVQQTNLLGSATAGILGIVGATSTAISITAIAFGLTAASIDNVTSGLLYELPPATIRDLVVRTREAYEAGLKPANWQDRPSSFRTIRGYVELCLPAVIEAHATAAIKASQPVAPARTAASDVALGATPRVQMSGPATAPPPAPPAGTPLNPRNPLPATPAAAAAELAPGRILPDEENLLRSDVVRLQIALCLPKARQDGSLGPETRAAIQAYRDVKRPTKTGALDRDEVGFLMLSGECSAQYRNAFERFSYPTGADISTLQKTMAAALNDSTVTISGILDAPTREAVKKLQKANGQAETGEITLIFASKLSR